VGSPTVVLGNGSEKNLLGVKKYHLRLRGENKLAFHDALGGNVT